MEACFSGLPTNYSSSQELCHPGKLSLEEQHRLELQLELLNARKNHLSALKMEIREEIYCASEQKKAFEASYSNQMDSITDTSRLFSEAQSELSTTLDKLADSFRKYYSTPDKEVRFFSQLDLKEWHQEEAKFTDALKAYISKQFREGVNEVAGARDVSTYCLLDVGHLDLHLVRGAGKMEYAQNVNELNRLNMALRKMEEQRLESLLSQARRKAEVEEANRLLGAINRGQLPNAVALLQQQTSEAVESRMLVDRERSQQHEVLLSLIEKVAELESTKTISGNCQLKCKRQEYFLEKVKIVIDELISQCARYDWLKIALDIDTAKIGDILKILKIINLDMSSRDAAYKKRIQSMEEMQKKNDAMRAVGQLPLPLATLSQILSPALDGNVISKGQQEHHSGDLLLRQVSNLNKSLTVARDNIATARNPQFSHLNNMSMNCEILEVALFGTSGSLRALPSTWIDPNLVERCDKLTQDYWKLKQKIMQLLVQYEEKKKFLSVEPTLRSEMMQWTVEVGKKLK
ncbi:hypothetical protein SK128_015935 [Halocaridina rubra]|uniref:HAUS augmin-like complex subunit 3 N-terminal domain-containing protein n=1 Tax=Halocaridina rubra TaxID=373956 RepID=A0AAN8WFM7_HALRR